MKKIFSLICVVILATNLKSQTLPTTNYTVCSGASATLVASNSTSLVSPSYSINPGALVTSTGIFVVTPSVSTSYTIYITGLNNQNNMVTNLSIHNVTTGPPPLVSVSVAQAICGGTTAVVTITASGSAVNPATVTWSPMPFSLSSNTQTAIYIIPTGQNATAVTITVYDAIGCAASVTAGVNPAPPYPTFTITNVSNSNSITCAHPSVALSASSNYSYGSLTYFWSSPSATFNTSNVTIVNPGTYTVTAGNSVSQCSITQAVTIGINTISPTSTVTPLLQNITCSLISVMNVTATGFPAANITHQLMSPLGGTLMVNSSPAVYTPGTIGTFTHCLVNDINGCSTCKTFTVTSNSGFPTFSVVSAQNFSLGCGTKSVVTLNIINGVTTPTPGGPLSYTVLGPPTSSNAPSGSLSPQSVYTMNIPGTWTVITKDNTNFCESRVALTIISNTFGPNISLSAPSPTLRCDLPQVQLNGSSTTPNVTYNWSWGGPFPGNMPGYSVNVSSNPVSPTSTVAANYTLTVIDNNNTCKSTTVVPVYQNLFPPIAIVTPSNPSLTCLTPSIMLNNQSVKTSPPTFPNNMPVITTLWQGPTPQLPNPSGATYPAYTPGNYTLSVKDLNNGCTASTVVVVADNRVFPAVTSPPDAFTLPCPGNNVTIAPIITGSTLNYLYAWTAPPTAIVSGVNSPYLTTNAPGFYTVTVTNTITNCSTTVLLAVYQCVGLEGHLNINEKLRVFPNPGKDLFTIESSEPGKNLSVQIYNTLGVMVKQQELVLEKNNLNLTLQPKGIYFVQVFQKGQKISTLKIIKE